MKHIRLNDYYIKLVININDMHENVIFLECLFKENDL